MARARVGTALFGKCDHVEGHGYVATKFLFAGVWPIVPLGTWFVTRSSWRSFTGTRIPWSFKSILLAYVRHFFGTLACLAAMVTVYTFALHGGHLVGSSIPFDGWISRLICGGATVVLTIPIVVTYLLFHRASPRRREELLVLLHAEGGAPMDPANAWAMPQPGIGGSPPALQHWLASSGHAPPAPTAWSSAPPPAAPVGHAAHNAASIHGQSGYLHRGALAGSGPTGSAEPSGGASSSPSDWPPKPGPSGWDSNPSGR